MAVPYTFGSATASIPLSQLDSNFATTITLGNTAVQLGNTITSLTGVSNVASATSLSLGSNGNTTAVTIDTSQNVGIGSTSPASDTANERILQVNAPTTFSTVSLSTSRASVAGQNIGKISFDVLNNTATYRSRAQINGQSAGSTANKYGAELLFFTASDNTADATERMRILSTGNILCLSGGSTSATGTGIAFPATQSASSNANTLDDYEEGTWTPTITGGTTNPTITYSTQSGTYTKVGRQVTITGRVSATAASGGSGQVQVSGLPFDNGSSTVGFFAMQGATSSVLIAAYLDGPNTYLRFYGNSPGNAFSAFNLPVSAGFDLIYNFSYFTS